MFIGAISFSFSLFSPIFLEFLWHPMYVSYIPVKAGLLMWLSMERSD